VLGQINGDNTGSVGPRAGEAEWSSVCAADDVPRSLKQAQNDGASESADENQAPHRRAQNDLSTARLLRGIRRWLRWSFTRGH
jgi:hypothetical protein